MLPFTVQPGDVMSAQQLNSLRDLGRIGGEARAGAGLIGRAGAQSIPPMKFRIEDCVQCELAAPLPSAWADATDSDGILWPADQVPVGGIVEVHGGYIDNMLGNADAVCRMRVPTQTAAFSRLGVLVERGAQVGDVVWVQMRGLARVLVAAPLPASGDLAGAVKNKYYAAQNQSGPFGVLAVGNAFTVGALSLQWALVNLRNTNRLDFKMVKTGAGATQGRAVKVLLFGPGHTLTQTSPGIISVANS